MKNLIMLMIMLFVGTVSVLGQEKVSVPLEDAGKRGKLVVDNKSGNVTVKGVPRKDVLVQYNARGNDGGLKVEDAGGGLKKISGNIPGLEISSNGNTVRVVAENWLKDIDIVVETPQDFDLVVSTYKGGEVIIQNINGEIETSNYTGPITAENISGCLVAQTYVGDIKASFKSISADQPMAFATYTGKIDLTLPASTKASFKMKSGNGDVYTSFDMDLQRSGSAEESKDKNGFKKIIEGWITGKLNGGGPEFRVETHMGDIYIRKG